MRVWKIHHYHFEYILEHILQYDNYLITSWWLRTLQSQDDVHKVPSPPPCQPSPTTTPSLHPQGTGAETKEQPEYSDREAN